MGSPQNRERCVRTIHLDDERVAEILDKLDERPEAPNTDRQSIRYRYRMKALAVHMQQPGSTITVPYHVPTRNISASGLSFLHGGFVHIGTRCLVQLITTYGTWDNVPASVTRCSYIDVNVHEVGVQFDRVIDPSIYCRDAVHSRVLLADDDPATIRLAAFHLEKLNADVSHAVNGQVAVTMALKEAYDIILMDMEMPVMDGFAATAELRKRGYRGTIVASTAMTKPDDVQRCLEAGCDKYIAKPFTRDALEELLQSIREEPLFSSFLDDPSMAEMTNGFVAELPGYIREMEEALIKNDHPALERIARLLKGKGTAFGFEIITEAATRLESVIQGDGSDEAIVTKGKKLINLCMHARATSQAVAADV